MKLRLVVAGAALAALAGAQTRYASQVSTIHAGVALVGSNTVSAGVPANDAPFVWYNLDSNVLAKPPGWSFENPSAEHLVTSSIQTRWSAVAAVVGGNTPNVGDRIDRGTAAYWEVQLSSASDTQLAQFDVLSLTLYSNLSLSPYERERLRRFVDQGGVLWVDFSGNLASVDPINGLPLPFNVSTVAGSGTRNADLSHPLLGSPNPLDGQALRALETTPGGALSPITPGSLGTTISFEQTIPADYTKLESIASDATGSTIALGRIGDGFVVITARGAAAALNQVQTASGLNTNKQYYALNPGPTRSGTAAARLIVNAISLTSSHNHVRGGTRQQNGSPIDVGAPLLQRFFAPRALPAGVYRPPTMFKGLLVAVDDSHLYVYSMRPGVSLDGQANPDGGIVDYATGTGYDLLWSSVALASPISSATCIEVANPQPGIPADQIVVVDGAGAIKAFDAFQLDGSRHITPTTAALPAYSVLPASGTAAYTSGVPDPGPFPPTYHEGVLYVADTQNAGVFGPSGRVWQMDPSRATMLSSGSGEFVIGGSLATGIGDLSAGPTVGYVPILDNSGGLDKVIYVPTRPNPAAAGSNSTAGLYSLWVGARGERPSSYTVVASSLQIRTRAATQGLDVYKPADLTVGNSLGFRLTLIKFSGAPYTQAEMTALFTGGYSTDGSGTVTVPMNQATLPADVAGVRVDYTIDWGNGAALTNSIVRGNLFFVDDSVKARRVLGGIAMSAGGNLFAVVSTADNSTMASAGGTLYCLNESGRGSFKLLYRYDMYGAYNSPLTQGGSYTVDPTFADRDGLIGASPTLQGAISQLTFTGSPAVSNGIVFVTAAGMKNGTTPVTVLMALRADPEPVEIRVGALNLDPGFQILQYDVTASDDKQDPSRFSLFQANQYSFEKDPASGYAVIHMDNLMGTTRGPVTNALSESQPILIRQSGQPDIPLWPDANGGTWSPLLWYACLDGYNASRGPKVTGDTVYVAGSSTLPSLLATGTIDEHATLIGIASDIGLDDPFTHADPARPWQSQVWWADTSGGGYAPNPNFRWPQIAEQLASTPLTLQQWQDQLALQPVLNGDSSASGVVAGDGALIAWTITGLFEYTPAEFIVADEGRLARFDSGGSPLWSSDASLESGASRDLGAVGNVHPLVRPTRAYAFGPTDTIVVDTAANRLVQLSVTGREERSIESFQLGRRASNGTPFAPEGYRSGEPLNFNSPRDVLSFTEFVTAASNTVFSNPQPLEYWVHTLVADGGNRRLLELVDRYGADPTTREVGDPVVDGGVAQLGILLWHSPAQFTGKNWEYSALARVYVPDPLNPRFVLAAGIGGTLPTRSDTGLATPDAAAIREEDTGNGGIVVFDLDNSQVVNAATLPSINPDLTWDFAAGAFGSASRAARSKKIAGLRSMTMRNVPDGLGGSFLSIMFTDSSGVYEIIPGASSSWSVDWMLPNEAFRAMRGVVLPYPGVGAIGPSADNPNDLSAVYARRLDSGDVLVANAYYGKTRAGDDFGGEVVQVDGRIDATETNGIPGFGFTKQNFGFQATSLRFRLQRVQRARDILVPVFADRR